MTTSRIVRGTKGRIFLYVSLVLVLTGIIACYNNTRIELDNAHKSNELCRQQQENLSTQLQVISDYKQRLEKSLKTEKAEHQQVKADLEQRISEEKSHSEKSASDAMLRFNSLQQQYSLLKTQHGDLTEECSKVQKDQLDEINDLQAKTKEVQGQLKQAERDKENSLEHLKSQLEQLKLEKANLEKQLKPNEEIVRLRKELGDLKLSCGVVDTLQAPGSQANSSSTRAAPIAKQVSLNNEEYRIVSNNKKNEMQVEQQQQNVLPMPQNLKGESKPSTPNSNLLNNAGASKPSLDFVPPLKVPTVTPDTKVKKTSEAKQFNNLPPPNARKFPDGIVPPHNFDLSPVGKSGDDNNVAGFVNNRYRNIVVGEEKKNDAAEKENVANEIFDVPISAGENKVKHHIDSLGVGGGGEKDKVYDGGDYDKDVQNDGNFEEDDDADDFDNHVQDPAIRN